MPNTGKYELLSELMKLSPEISEHVLGVRDEVSNEDADKLKINDILNNCFVILIDLLREQGINSYADSDSILNDYYNARHLITLFDVFIIDKLESYLNNDQKLYENIKASTEGVSSDELIVKILDSYQKVYPTDDNRSMYTFLWDKIISTEEYYDAFNKMMQKLDNLSKDDDIGVVNNTTLEFVSKLVKDRAWYIKVLGMLKQSERFGKLVDYANDIIHAESFRSEFIKGSRINILADYTNHRSNSEVIDKLFSDIHRDSKFYLEYYTSRQLAPSFSEIVGIIIAKISDKLLFDIDPDFSVLPNFFDDVEHLIVEIQNVPETK